VRLIDVTGRVVRKLADGELPGGAQPLTWDGRDDRGRAMPAGVYFARAEWQGRAVTGKVVYLGR
jgi:flagellar hook assembly protein FlgD